LWSFHIGSGQYPAALALAQRFCTLAANQSDPDDRLVGKRLIGIAQHYLGDQNSARRHLDGVFADDVIPGRRHIIRFHIDPHVAARVFLARILWLQGFPDQAMHTAERSAEGARADDHAPSLCYILALGAFPVSLLVGDLAAAEHYAGMLLDHSTRHSLARLRAYGRCHQGALAIKRGDLNTGLRLLHAGFDELGGSSLTESQKPKIVYFSIHQPQIVVFGPIFIRIGGPEWTGDQARGVKRALRLMSRHSEPCWVMPIGTSRCMTTAWGC
jgi:hypothetical protein